MTNPQRFLNRVALFLLATLIVVAAVYDILWRAFMHNPALNGLILGVLALGVAYAVRRIIMLRPEVRWIEAFRSAGPGFSLQEPPRLLAPVATVLGDREPSGEVLSTLSMRYLLDSISARLEESRDITRYQTGLLIFLGLLGTFWGLLETINAVALVIAELQLGTGDLLAVFEDLKAGLSAPLSGMGTAFSSSLFGLAGSLVLGFIDLQATRAQNSFYNDVEEWLSGLARHSAREAPPAAVTAAPLPAPGKPMPAYVEALLRQTAEGLSRIERVLREGEEARAVFHQQVAALGHGIGALNDRLQRDQEVLARIAEAQRVTVQKLGGRDGSSALDEATLGHLRSIDRQLARLLEEVVRSRDEVTRELANEIRVVARTIAIAAGEPQIAGE